MGLASEVETTLLKSNTFGKRDRKMTLRSLSFKSAESGTKMTSICSCQEVLPDILNFKGSEMGCIAHEINAFDDDPMPTHSCNLENDQVYEQNSVKGLSLLFSPRPRRELDAAAVMLQKVYKSYRTRRNLADCAVVVEELWWKALDFASLEHSSISFFNVQKPETAISRWARARTRAAKVGKGLSKNNKAQKLALRHWLEAIDPRHRYGHNLHFYYDVWFDSESAQPFFYWLDVGGGKEVNLEKCPRIKLQQQCIKYLGPNEREKYEVIFKKGNLVYKQSEMFVNTDEGSKWIFVLSTSRALYVGQKIKGKFQHSSFLAGGATTSAGRLVVKEGILKAVWPYSGHYLPTEENFKDFINFLIENNVDLSDVKRCPTDDDEIDDNKSFKKRSLDDEYPSFKNLDIEPVLKESGGVEVTELPITTNRPELLVGDMEKTLKESNNAELATDKKKELTKHLSYKWSTGAGPRIGCVRDYPVDLQSKALEQVNLSPRIPPSPMGAKGPIRSPRPSPALRLSPRLVYMAFPTPTKKITLTLPKPKRK